MDSNEEINVKEHKNFSNFFIIDWTVLIYKDETMPYELLWDLTDEIDCAETDAVGLLGSLSPFISFGFPLNLSIASWHSSLNHSSSGSSLETQVMSDS